MRISIKTLAATLASTLALTLVASAVPFWGAKESAPVDADPAKLAPGEFIWEGEAVAAGPVTVVVSLEEQRAPIDATSGVEAQDARLGLLETERWTPEAAAEGPIAIVVSGADRRAIVFRNGVEIGRAKIRVRDADVQLGTHAFVRLDEKSKRPDAASTARWVAVGVPGHEAEKGLVLDPASSERVTLPPDFAEKLRTLLAPGDTLLVTDGAVLDHTTGVSMTLVTSDPPHAAEPGQG